MSRKPSRRTRVDGALPLPPPSIRERPRGAWLAATTAIFLAGPCAPQARAAERGDINNDGVVDITDAILLFEWLTRNPDAAICLNLTDVNQDGKIEFSDGIQILQHMFCGKKMDPFPPGYEVECSRLFGSLEIRNQQVTLLSPSSALITWQTPLPSGTRVKFGTEISSLHEEVNVVESVLFHQALLRDLPADTAIFFQVSSESGTWPVANSEIGTFRTLSEDEVSFIRPDHPRIFFTAEDLPVIRSKISRGGPFHEMWGRLAGWCQSKLDMSPREMASESNLSEYGRAFAFAAAVGGDADIREKALEMASFLAGYSPDEEDDLRDATDALALLYDWIHPQIPDSKKEGIRRRLHRNTLALRDRHRDDEFVTGHSQGNNKHFFLGALALHGEEPGAEEILEEAVHNFRHGFIPMWRRFAGWDGGSTHNWWYTTYMLPFALEFLAAWRSATGKDLFLQERIWCEGMLGWFLFGLRGDGSFLREGDVYLRSGLEHQNRHYGLLLAREYGNPQARWLAAEAEAASGMWAPRLTFDILWGDSGVEPAPPFGPTARWFRGAGVVVMRQSWSRDSAIGYFRSAEAYTLGHSHRDNCSFTLYYKGDLAIDSGIYDDYDSTHRENYYCRTVAHNTITVFDPDEVFVKHGDEWANDGGQRWLTPEDVPSAYPATADDTIDRSRGYRLGGILRFEDTESYTYAVGDGAPSYSRAKIEKFLRHFLWLKNVSGWSCPVAVVFDDVVATRASFRKAYLLHTVSEPQVRGRTVTARDGGGVLYHQTVVPALADISLIGGRGKEFLVGDRNYPPMRDPVGMEEPGAWRVEVSPTFPKADQRFLHVLYPADAGTPEPSESKGFVVGPLQGCTVGDWMVFFDFAGSAGDVAYSSSRERSSHIILGGVPLSQYEIFLDGALQDRISTSFAGTLRFDLNKPGQVRVRLVNE